MTTMISDLPMDLVIKEIICRLPMKSVKAVRLTCKSWNDLSKSEIGKVTRPTREGETMMIAVMHRHKLYLMSGFFNGVDTSIEQRGRLKFVYHVNIYRVYHYEGLLLCIMKDVTKIVVWNPYLGQTRSIKLRYYYFPPRGDMFNYSLGYEEDKELCRHFKVLRFVDFFHREPEEQFFWYEMYDFDTGLWTTLDVAPHWRIYCSSGSVSLKGNSYWCAKGRSSEGFVRDHIICFDFTRERFGPLLPLPSCVIRDRKYAYVNLSCVKEEKIAALFRHEYASEFEIWITTKIEVETVSWSKFLRIDTKVWITFPDCFFIDEEKKVFVCVSSDYIDIIGEAGYLKELDSGLPVRNHCLPHVNSYVPSLVQIKKLSRADKRIEQSSIEKRRFDQKMLRLAEIEKLMKTRHEGRFGQYFTIS